MYEELIEDLREVQKRSKALHNSQLEELTKKAADAIEELSVRADKWKEAFIAEYDARAREYNTDKERKAVEERPFEAFGEWPLTDYIGRNELLRDYQMCDGVECERCPFRKGPECKVREFISDIPAADVRPVVTCADCKYNNACLTQAYVEDESRVPFDRSTFFCADGKRADDA